MSSAPRSAAGGALTVRPRRRSRRAPRAVRELPFLLPALIMVLGLMVVPGVYALVQSFTHWNPGYPSPWAGFENYTNLFKAPGFGQILENHAFLLLGLPLWTFVPLLLAVVLFERVPAQWLFRTLFLFPAILSPTIVGILWRGILRNNDGFLNATLRSVGLDSLAHPWIDSASLVKPTLIFVLLWSTLGIGIVIYGAALTSIPSEQLEAAALDGAGWWRRLWHVILPHVAPIAVFYAVYSTINIFLFSFGYIYVLTNGGPGYSSTTFDVDIYQNALRFGNYGTAAAESVVLCIVVGTLAGLAFAGSKLMRRRAR